MTFPARRNIIERIGFFTRRLRAVFHIEQIRGIDQPPLPTPGMKNREKRKKRQSEDNRGKNNTLKVDDNKLREVLAEEDEELKEIEEGLHKR